ncbi:MAG: 4Fe-4S dicluster domain-containing protein [Oligoflexia bacterium]|nr:4Fe-4S dicluster domain-containing protein [Oligoflexia bacterium]MBF0366191.1 4Fe-4S dicluster domain-containing protein [Oligoflexia bacterium]
MQAHPHTEQDELKVMGAKCYQCGKCSAGCPLASQMELSTSQMMRQLQLGNYDAIYRSNSLWVCVACETCQSRCPQEIKIVEIWDTLRNRLFADKKLQRKYATKGAVRHILLAHKIFLSNIYTFGRIFEPMLAAIYNLRSGDLFKDASKGPSLLVKGKLPLLPHRINGIKEFQRIFKNVEKYRAQKG